MTYTSSTSLLALTFYVTDAIINATTVTFDYTDADGAVSVRTVNPTAIRRCLNGETCVVAYDLQRNAPRCFRLDRIGSCVAGVADCKITLTVAT